MTDTTDTRDPLASRIRTSLAVAQNRLSEVPARARAQWSDLPEIGRLPTGVREAIDRAIDSAKIRLRDSLDLPSRSEIAELVARVEDLDRKIEGLRAEPAEIVGAVEPRRAKKPAAAKSSAKTSKARKTTAAKTSARTAKTTKAGGAKKSAKPAVDKSKRREAIKQAAKKPRS